MFSPLIPSVSIPRPTRAASKAARLRFRIFIWRARRSNFSRASEWRTSPRRSSGSTSAFHARACAICGSISKTPPSSVGPLVVLALERRRRCAREVDGARRSSPPSRRDGVRFAIPRLQHDGRRPRHTHRAGRQSGSDGACMKVLAGGCRVYSAKTARSRRIGNWTARSVISPQSRRQAHHPDGDDYAAGVIARRRESARRRSALRHRRRRTCCHMNGFAYAIRPGIAPSSFRPARRTNDRESRSGDDPRRQRLLPGGPRSAHGGRSVRSGAGETRRILMVHEDNARTHPGRARIASVPLSGLHRPRLPPDHPVRRMDSAQQSAVPLPHLRRRHFHPRRSRHRSHRRRFLRIRAGQQYLLSHRRAPLRGESWTTPPSSSWARSIRRAARARLMKMTGVKLADTRIEQAASSSRASSPPASSA